jgi:triosephosphate isomerase (TIM)
MRIPLIAGNWKMNTTVNDALALIKDIIPQLDEIANIDKIVCPPFVSLVPVYNALLGSRVKVGAQNLYYEEKGAYTGEISALMLVGICEYVIIGHSERRQCFHETGEMISKKVLSAIKSNLKPILCVGENLKEYKEGLTRTVVASQLESSLAGVIQADTLIIAYEPLWAIGTGKAATGNQAEETIKFIRSQIESHYNWGIASNMRILYGGSVTAGNIAEFVSQPDVDGALVGGASLKSKEFVSIVKITSEIRSKP